MLVPDCRSSAALSSRARTPTKPLKHFQQMASVGASGRDAHCARAARLRLQRVAGAGLQQAPQRWPAAASSPGLWDGQLAASGLGRGSGSLPRQLHADRERAAAQAGRASALPPRVWVVHIHCCFRLIDRRSGHPQQSVPACKALMADPVPSVFSHEWVAKVHVTVSWPTLQMSRTE